MAASTPTTEEDFSDDVLTDDVEEDMPGEAVDEMALEPPLPATEGPTLDSYQAIITAFMEFLTVATHTILYERNIYPRASFLRARKYDYPVRQNRHPGVCKFIMDAMTAIEAEMIKVGRSICYGFRYLD